MFYVNVIDEDDK